MGEYLEKVPCASATLVIFDQRTAVLRKSWAARIRVEVAQPLVAGVAVLVVPM